MIVDLPRRWRWVVAVGCALVALLAVVFVWSTKSAERRAAIVLPVVPVLASATVETPVAASAVPAMASGSAPRGVDQIEVCGGGWVAVEADGTPDPVALEAATGLNAALENVLARMRGAGDELTRASAALLASNGQPGWLERLFGSGADSARDALAREASTTADPAVYGLAFRECAQPGSSVDNSCRLLNAPRWSQLDPSNARPWFYILDAAMARKDYAGVAEALHRIASAERDDSGFLVSARSVLGVLPDDDGALLAGRTLVYTAIGTEVASPVAGAQAVIAACRGDALQDANRKQTCEAIADLMLDRSDTLLAHSIGIVLGGRLGWPADRVDALRGQMGEYVASLAEHQADELSLTCPAMRQTLQRLRERATVGEAAELRHWVAQSGQSPEDFVKIAEAQRAARAQAAASVASAASGS